MRKSLMMTALLLGTALAGPAAAEFWTGPNNTGLAISKDPTTSNNFVAYYGYRIDGTPTFRIANQGDQSNVHFNGATYSARGGQVLGETWQAATLTEAGNVRLTFANVEQGTLQLDDGLVQDLTRTVIQSGRPAPTTNANYLTTGWYWNASEPGTGYAVEVQGDTFFATVFSYLSNGDDVWYMTTGGLTRNGNATWSYSGPLNYCAGSPVVCTSVGTISFVGINNRATVTLPSGSTVNLSPFTF